MTKRNVTWRAVGMTDLSVTAQYFVKGNGAMRNRYGERFPWRERSLDLAAQ